MGGDALQEGEGLVAEKLLNKIWEGFNFKCFGELQEVSGLGFLAMLVVI